MTASPGWLTTLLACPRCQEPLVEGDEGWACGRCGPVGRRTMGFPDFLGSARSLPMAGGDSMDVAADDAAGAELARDAASADFAQLSRRAAALQAEAAGRSAWSPARQDACDRFHARLGRVNIEAAARGGQALLAKLDGKIDELGWPPLKGSLALEAAGGAGYFLPAFAERFGRVVFVDASLPGLVLAAKLAEEQGLKDVAFVRADVVHLPFAPSTFDFVHENGVIEHVHDPQRMLAEAARVRDDGGYYVCVSPNRFSLAPEPHFGVPLYGAVPAMLRRRMVRKRRGFEDGAGTDLRSLPQLRRDVAGGLAGDETAVFFLPRRLPFTARQTGVRRLVRRALGSRRAGDVVDHALNVTLLPVMPQHIVIARRPASSSPPPPVTEQRPVRIAHVINARGLGGAERFYATVVRRGQERGFDQLVLIPFATPASAEFTALLGQVPWAARRCAGLSKVPSLWNWLRRELDRFAPDVVHASLFHATALTATVPRPGQARRLLTNVYGPGLRVLPHPRAREALDRWAAGRYDRVAAISASVQQFLVSAYGLPEEKVVCIPLGWEGTPVPAAAGDGPPTVVCVARLRTEKGHEVLVDAFATVCRTIPDARLLLVGDGELRARIEADVEARGLEARVEITGPVDEVWPYLARGHVFALASHSEAYGIAIAEAMAAGLPVVASAVGGIPELVEEGVTGELFPAGDAGALAAHLVRILQSPELRRRMGEAAQAAAGPLRMERSADRYLDLCQELAAGDVLSVR